MTKDPLKELVDRIFDSFEEDKVLFEKRQSATATRDNPEDGFQRAKGYADEELAKLHEAFIEFQNKIAGLAVTQVLVDGILELGRMCEFLEGVLTGRFAKAEESAAANKEYANLQRLRAELLTTILDHYEGNDLPF